MVNALATVRGGHIRRASLTVEAYGAIATVEALPSAGVTHWRSRHRAGTTATLLAFCVRVVVGIVAEVSLSAILA